jgi:hypothetical protein
MWSPPVLLDATAVARPGRIGRPLLAVGLVALLGATLYWRTEAGSLVTMETTLRDAQRPRPVVVERPDPAAEARRRWIERELNHPWPVLFEALEVARTPMIRLNSVEVATSNGQVALQGQARRLADVLDLAERLTEQSLQDVTILSHQPLSDAGERALGFQLSARWSATRPQDGATPAGSPK